VGAEPTATLMEGRFRTADSGVAQVLEGEEARMSSPTYARMTVAAVAALAEVSEPTVYLRYPTKRDLALAAATHIPLLVDPPDTGDAFDDLTALLTRLVTATQAARGMALTGAVLAEEHDHPEL
jgi:AcrR family transcriptional regulator